MEIITDTQVIRRLGDPEHCKKVERIAKSGNFKQLWKEYMLLALSFVELRDEYRKLQKDTERLITQTSLS